MSFPFLFQFGFSNGKVPGSGGLHKPCRRQDRHNRKTKAESRHQWLGETARKKAGNGQNLMMTKRRIVRLLAAAAMALTLPLGAGGGLSAETTAAQQRGAVTNLPLPRYVTLKAREGNARRGPGLTHRIDWVFTTAGMPLRITAEHDNWRRVEDVDGLGGWVHYSLLSGVRAVLVQTELADLRSRPQADAPALLRAETGVIARLLACQTDWCELAIGSEKGWMEKSMLWGVEPDESFE
jgi:SH3-like domain-containing protein